MLLLTQTFALQYSSNLMDDSRRQTESAGLIGKVNAIATLNC